MKYNDTLSGKYTRVPVYRELRINSFDFMSLVKAMDRRGYCIFLESAGKTKEKGRFSFLCFNPAETIAEKNGRVVITENGESVLYEGTLFDYIDKKISGFTSPVTGEFGDFNGGYAGYAGSISSGCNMEDDVTAEFMLVDEFVVFDNHTGRYHLCTVVYPDAGDARVVAAVSEARLDSLEHEIMELIAEERIHFLPSKSEQVAVDPAVSMESFLDSTERLRENLSDSGMPLASVSLDFRARGEFSAFSFYMKLRGVSPSPYMYYMHLPHSRIAGSSPETHLKIRSGTMTMKPASGYTAVPQSRHGRAAVRRELLRSVQDRGVHSVLVDYARDSLAASAVEGTVTVKNFMDTVEYQNRLRMVTKINAILRPGMGMAAALGGTVNPVNRASGFTGSEDARTTTCASGVSVAGYFGFNRCCDLCVMTGCAVFNQSGAVIQGHAHVHAESISEDVLAAVTTSASTAAICLGFALPG
ncbi:MAG: hypothetical protein GXY14_13175 [Spirochaetes bacterium]|nr:hypothetical protein [Spirochaetota bacterium]